MRYFIELAYNGTNYHGWQYQPNATSVQETLNKALTLLLKTTIDVVGAGRTDTGVHAKQMFAHFDISTKIDVPFYVHKLNSFLPKDIAIIEIHEGATNNITSPSGKIDQGLPTIRAVKLNGKKWKEYEGDRSVKDMVNFIKDNFNDKKTMSGGKGTKRKSSKRKSSKSKRKSKGTKSKGTKHKGIKRKSKRKSFSKSKKGRKY